MKGEVAFAGFRLFIQYFMLSGMLPWNLKPET
jgi:hypothetical protein